MSGVPMRPEDYEAGRARSAAILDVLIKDSPAGSALTPAASVAAAACALAALAHLAECGAGAAEVLFEGFYESIRKRMNEGKRMNEAPSGKKP